MCLRAGAHGCGWLVIRVKVVVGSLMGFLTPFKLEVTWFLGEETGWKGLGARRDLARRVNE